jgi:hypothetical protein
MKTLPSKVNILGQLWTVEIVLGLKDDEMNPVDGLCVIERLCIQIEQTLPVERSREILLHEIIHCIEYVFDLELSERQVEKLARGLYGSFASDSMTRCFIFGET